MLNVTTKIFFNSKLTTEEIMDLVHIEPLEYNKCIKTVHQLKLRAVYGRLK